MTQGMIFSHYILQARAGTCARHTHNSRLSRNSHVWSDMGHTLMFNVETIIHQLKHIVKPTPSWGFSPLARTRRSESGAYISVSIVLLLSLFLPLPLSILFTKRSI